MTTILSRRPDLACAERSICLERGLTPAGRAAELRAGGYGQSGGSAADRLAVLDQLATGDLLDQLTAGDMTSQLAIEAEVQCALAEALASEPRGASRQTLAACSPALAADLRDAAVARLKHEGAIHENAYGLILTARGRRRVHEL